MLCGYAGGGGEAGPASRCPEAQLSQLIDAGITTAVGVLGTDGISRSQVPKKPTFHLASIVSVHNW